MDFSYDRVLGQLPDPLRMHDGSRMTDSAQWPQKRAELLADVVPLLYGGMPPEPEVFELLPLFVDSEVKTYLITAGTRQKTVRFELKLRLPRDAQGPCPVVLDGDGCFRYLNDEVVRDANQRGFAVGSFNRTVLAMDVFRDARSHARHGGLYEVYPEARFGALAAWAWGYHRAVDALMQLPELIDPQAIAVTGHSRGGKTTLLAAATDPRITFCNTNCSGAAGAGCFRYEQHEAPDSPQHDHACETLADLVHVIPFWLGPDAPAYVGREAELPFDQHFLKAAVAPRWLLETDCINDIWGNPRGSYQTYRAARAVYRALGAEDHIACVFRDRVHYHEVRDYQIFFDFIEDVRAGRPFLQDNADRVMAGLPLAFDLGKPE